MMPRLWPVCMQRGGEILAKPPSVRRTVVIDDAHLVVTESVDTVFVEKECGVLDEEILHLMDRSAVTFQVVLTKADKISLVEKAAVIEQVKAALAKHVAAYPEIIVTSSEQGEGIETLRAVIATMI